MTVAKKQPERTCIGCGRKGNKAEFIRIVRSPEGVFALDETGRMNGRGAYLCRQEACFRQAVRRRALHRAFREAVPAEALEKLEGEWAELRL